MSNTVLITGNSSGLGLGLTEVYLAAGWEVYGLSRRGCPTINDNLLDQQCDLGNVDAIGPALERLLDDVSALDLVYLNAGIFGQMGKLAEISLEQIKQVMDVNVWANKIILDWIFARGMRVAQVIGISSGAAISANIGWGAYSTSKIALNKLMALYANEFSTTHFTSLAPGLVDTAMQDYLCDESLNSLEDYPMLKKFHAARGTDTMPSADVAAMAIADITSDLLALDSGSFADIRDM